MVGGLAAAEHGVADDAGGRGKGAVADVGLRGLVEDAGDVLVRVGHAEGQGVDRVGHPAHLLMEFVW